MKIAIVVDASGSMLDNLVGIFTLSAELKKVEGISLSGGIDTSLFQKLLEDYDKIYFFTDGVFPVDPTLLFNVINGKIEVIKVG